MKYVDSNFSLLARKCSCYAQRGLLLNGALLERIHILKKVCTERIFDSQQVVYGSQQ